MTHHRSSAYRSSAPPPPRLSRRRPRLAEIRSLIGIERPRFGTAERIARVATVTDLRALARRRTPRAVFDYVDGAAEDEISKRRASETLDRIEWQPLVLRDVGVIDPSTSILGHHASMPLVLAPTGFTRMMHHEGEYAVGYAAAQAGIPYALSTMGTVTPEELSATVPADGRWFQLYLWRDRDASRDLLDRAAAAGFDTLVLTVDTPVSGRRLRDVRNGLTIPPSLTVRTMADMARHPQWWFHLLTTDPLSFATLTRTDGNVADMVDRVFDPSADFDDLSWLCANWQGSVVVKGIQSVADAQACIAAGAAGVVLSNHGGRQLDRAPVPLELLPQIRTALGSEAAVFVDGGFLNGADVAAAVALGADAVLVGRAYLYGLMAGGRQGVARVLHIMQDEFERTMRLLGVTTVAQLTPDRVRLRAQL